MIFMMQCKKTLYAVGANRLLKASDGKGLPMQEG